MHIYYIDKIIESGDDSKMEKLKDILLTTITYLKRSDYAKYEDIECKLYEIVEGKKLTEEKAREWTNNMRPSAKWTMEELQAVKDRMNVDIPIVDFYALMNMLYSDFSNVLGDSDISKYVQFAKSWYYDDDVKMDGSEKLYLYWKQFGR